MNRPFLQPPVRGCKNNQWNHVGRKVVLQQSLREHMCKNIAQRPPYPDTDLAAFVMIVVDQRMNFRTWIRTPSGR